MAYRVNPHSADRSHPSRTTIHVASCRTIPDPVPDRWRTFETYDEAYEFALSTPYPVNLCGVCLESG